MSVHPALRSCVLVTWLLVGAFASPAVVGIATAEAGNVNTTAVPDREPSMVSAVEVLETSGDANDSVVADDARFETVVRSDGDREVRVVVSRDDRYQASSDLMATGPSPEFDLGSVPNAAGVWTVYAAENATHAAEPAEGARLERWGEAEARLLVANTSAVSAKRADSYWQSSRRVWRGSDRFLKSDRVAADADAVWTLYELSDGGPIRLGAVTLDENAEVVVDTSRLDGRYVVVSEEGRVLRFDREGRVVERTPVSDEAALRRAAVTVSTQDLTVATENASVATRPTTLKFDSNRAQYTVTVRADGLSTAELGRMVDGSRPVERGDDVAIRVTPERGRVRLNLSGVERGRYVLNIVVTDSTADASVPVVRFGEQDVAAAFTTRVHTTGEGGVVRVPIRLRNADRATVSIGSPAVNYHTTAEVVDTDGDGVVLLTMNAWLAGRSVAANERAYAATDGRVRDVTLHTDPVASPPLDVANYPLALSVRGREKHAGLVAVQNRSVKRPRTLTAPAADYAELDSVEAVRAANDRGPLTSDTTVADGDVAVLELRAPGLVGWLAANPPDDADVTDAFVDGVASSDSFSVQVRERDPAPNEPPARLDLRSTAAADGFRVVTDTRNGTVFLVVDTARAVLRKPNGATRTLGPADDLQTNLTVGRTNGALDGQRTAVADWQIVERRVTVDGPRHVRPASCQRIMGQSTLAPGTSLHLRVHGTDGRTVALPETSVESTGRFDGTANFSDVEPNTTLAVSPHNERGPTATVRVVDRSPAAVRLRNQSAGVSGIHIDAVRLPAGGFVVVYDASGFDVVGVSERLDAGVRRDVRIPLDRRPNESFTAVAVPHADTDGDGRFDGPAVDISFHRSCDVVTASASIGRANASAVRRPDSTTPETGHRPIQSLTVEAPASASDPARRTPNVREAQNNRSADANRPVPTGETPSALHRSRADRLFVLGVVLVVVAGSALLGRRAR
ncbi:hypothetical protein EGH21_21210 [Halomicroarcula sp. F13]|uniref:Uncharacterized protein n=1 Tax=Haloarcula rubra TaxID=2487747 RepID=A0AAW4PWY2_9EURY|nr:hypothetical protein [Halomicroarcula rubra]MBX0325548.1 hypothetical protein [Halomicroarcula rubra]